MTKLPEVNTVKEAVRLMDNPYIADYRDLKNNLVEEQVSKIKDTNNDHAIIFDLTTQISDVIKTAIRYRKEQALAFDNNDTLTQIIDALDDVQFNVIRPHQEQIDESRELFT
jgi:hypothetical protein